MKRDSFGSKLGILAAAAGSAIGLGNIWKFPYVVGENGGAAFILVYLLCIVLIGLPVMISEFALGRNAQANVVDTYTKIKPSGKWSFIGYIGVLTAFILLSFYSMIAGWVFSYLSKSISGSIASVTASELPEYFNVLVANGSGVLFWTAVVLILTGAIGILGVKNGIEKATKILMPALFIILIVLMIKSLTLEGSSTGIDFLFKPDFSKLTTHSILEALGHAFYSLSLAIGVTLTYGSYIKKSENILSISMQVTIADTLIALMAGIVIFPAVFAYGFEPAQGPSLIFITLPAVFKSMPMGNLIQTLFFLLIGIAAITSTIALLEVIMAFVIEKFNISRKKATVIIVTALFSLAIPSILSFGAWSEVKIFGRTFFDNFDYLVSNIFLPVSGLLTCIFVGWVWGTKDVIEEVTNGGQIAFKMRKVYTFLIKYLAPIAITVILLNSLGIIG